MANRIIRLQDIVEEVQKHHPEADTDLIEKAYIFSAKAHEGQLRLSGEPYLSHPLEVAYLLAKMGLGPVTVSSGLLHDTVEDSAASLDDLEEYFGEEVADVVNGVTKIGQLVFMFNWTTMLLPATSSVPSTVSSICATALAFLTASRAWSFGLSRI